MKKAHYSLSMARQGCRMWFLQPLTRHSFPFPLANRECKGTCPSWRPEPVEYIYSSSESHIALKQRRFGQTRADSWNPANKVAVLFSGCEKDQDK